MEEAPRTYFLGFNKDKVCGGRYFFCHVFYCLALFVVICGSVIVVSCVLGFGPSGNFRYLTFAISSVVPGDVVIRGVASALIFGGCSSC